MALYFCILLVFLLNPFLALILSVCLLFSRRTSDMQVTFCLVVISLFWGLLAFTQKSLAKEDTDCIRYYISFGVYESMDPIKALSSLKFSKILNFVFTPVTVFLVSLTKNVQIMSFFWTFLVYLLTFLSMRHLLSYFWCYDQRNFAKMVIAQMLCFMAFVQISELLKQSAAFAVFFYGFTFFITGGGVCLSLLLVLCAIGIHPSVLMLLPLFLYKKVKIEWLFIVLVLVFALSLLTNIIDLVMSFLPSTTYFSLLLGKYGGHVGVQTATLHYVLIQLIMLFFALFMLVKNRCWEVENMVKIVLLYLTISFINYYNLTAYLRFAIFSHWIMGLILIMYIKFNYLTYSLWSMKKMFLTLMFLMTLRWTIARTLTNGGYCSSYMDNSITNIIVSPSFEYLSVDYEISMI